MEPEEKSFKTDERIALLLLLFILGSIFIVGIYGTHLQDKADRQLIKQCESDKECIDFVKQMKPEAFNCFENTRCKEFILNHY